MAKVCLNPECHKSFEPKSSKGLYCSPACKSRHQYLERKKAAEPPPAEPTKPIKDPTEKWIDEVKLYCLQSGITPDDLIEFHQMHVNKDTSRALMALKNSLIPKMK